MIRYEGMITVHTKMSGDMFKWLKRKRKYRPLILYNLRFKLFSIGK
jgi:hypothetical protein